MNMNRIIKIPASKPSFDHIDAILRDTRSVLESGRLILGPYTQAFEIAFAKYIGVPYAVATSSCTAALEIVLKYVDVRDREVIVPANTFIACPNSVVYAGGIPIFAETRESTFCLDYNDVIQKVTSRTKVIMVVHLAGMPMPEILKLKTFCKKRHIFLLEDGSHAHGATINNKKVGSIGDAGCFSFYPTKTMTTGVGGMITTRDKKLVVFARSMRHHGQGASLDTIKTWGNDWVMDEISAVLGIRQLASLEKNMERRNRIARRYVKGLEKIDGIIHAFPPTNVRHAYYKFLTTVTTDIPKKKIIETLQADGIEVGTLYGLPCYLNPIYKKRGYKKGFCSETEKIISRQIALPIFPSMTDAQIEYVLKSLKRAVSTPKKS
jgi:dTDP-4-amino-4,6-dideoxygalactose transaminase